MADIGNHGSAQMAFAADLCSPGCFFHVCAVEVTKGQSRSMDLLVLLGASMRFRLLVRVS